MNSVEHDLALYLSGPLEEEETTICRCGQEVRPDELIEIREWIGSNWIFDLVCKECAKEDQ